MGRKVTPGHPVAQKHRRLQEQPATRPHLSTVNETPSRQVCLLPLNRDGQKLSYVIGSTVACPEQRPQAQAVNLRRTQAQPSPAPKASTDSYTASRDHIQRASDWHRRDQPDGGGHQCRRGGLRRVSMQPRRVPQPSTVGKVLHPASHSMTHVQRMITDSIILLKLSSVGVNTMWSSATLGMLRCLRMGQLSPLRAPM